MHRIIVAGAGTEVGKTIVAAILTTLFNGEYWKPIECGEDPDSLAMEKLIGNRIHPPSYNFKAPLSPHHAARLENVSINPDGIVLPQTKKPLIIESVGGVYVPLNLKVLSLDLFQAWNCQWVIVSRHYVGSINHTLLTVDALKQRSISVAGIIFNGLPNPDSERAILEFSKLPPLARLLPETHINKKTIERYAQKWHPLLL